MHERNLEFERLWLESGLNQPAIAEKLQISQATVSRYLAGKIVPRPAVIRSLRLIVDGASRTAEMIDPEGKQLLDVIHSLEPQSRKKILEAFSIILSQLSKSDSAVIVDVESGDRVLSAFEKIGKAAIDQISEQGSGQPTSGVMPQAKPFRSQTKKT